MRAGINLHPLINTATIDLATADLLRFLTGRPAANRCSQVL